MTKFARLVGYSNGDPTFSVADMFTTDPDDDTTPMKVPDGVGDPVEWLTRMFGGFEQHWSDRGEQFREVPQGVLPGASFFGDRDADVADASKYDNRNGFYADGSPVPVPEPKEE